MLRQNSDQFRSQYRCKIAIISGSMFDNRFTYLSVKVFSELSLNVQSGLISSYQTLS